MAIETRIIQVRRGREAELDKSKFLPGEFGSATDTQKIFHAFAPNKVKELASKEDVQELIDGFTSVVDREIAEAEQRIENKAETVLGTIPDDYETVSKKADEAVRTKADAIVCTVSGVNPIAKDSSNDYLRNLKLYGKTTQTTTTGKQLLPYPYDNTTISTNGINFVDNGDGSLTLSGTATSNAYFHFASNENGCIDSSVRQFYCSTGVALKIIDSDGTARYTVGAVKLADNETVVGIYMQINSGETINKTFYPMINEGTTALPWEPYTGGIASPSPQYSQPLESVGKWGNLCNLPDVEEVEYNGVKWSCKNGAVTAKGTTGSSYPSYTKTIGIIHDITGKKGTFYISGSKNNVKVFVSVKSASGSSSIYTEQSFTLDGTETEVVIYLQVALSTTVDTTVYPMLNEGTTALPYRPYSGQKEVESGVHGKNKLENTAVSQTINGVTVTVNEDKSVTVNGTATVAFALNLIGGPNNYALPLEKGEYILSGITGGSNSTYFLQVRSESTMNVAQGTTTEVTFKHDGSPVRVYFYITSGYTVNETIYPMIRKAEITDGTYVPYTKQSHISLVSDGLKGIPVTDSSLATYTDENGQRWCSDYVDCERGANVQKIKRLVLDGTERWITYSANGQYGLYNSDTGVLNTSRALCSHYQNSYSSESNTFYVGSSGMAFFTEFETVDEWKAFLAEQYANGTPVTVQYILATPIETPLTASEIASFKALHSNYKVTSVMNDCECFEELQYNADTETWINNKIEARVASALASLAL